MPIRLDRFPRNLEMNIRARSGGMGRLARPDSISRLIVPSNAIVRSRSAESSLAAVDENATLRGLKSPLAQSFS